MRRASDRTGLFKRLRRDKRGVAFLEFALIAPVLIIFYFGTVEFCLALLAERRADHTAAAVGDLVAQDSALTQTEMQDIFRISRTIMAPYATTNMQIRVSQVSKNGSGTATVDWGCVSSNWTKRASSDTSGLPLAVIANNQSMIVAETRYQYDSPVDMWLPNLTTFSTVIAYRPRLSNTIPTPTGGTCTGL